MGRRWSVLLLLPTLLSVGCINWRGPQDMRRDLSSAAGVQLNREFGLTVRRSAMWIARAGMRFAGEDGVSLKGVHSVRIGVYTVEGLRRGQDDRVRLGLSELPDWEPIVEVHDEGEDIFVLTRLDDGRIRGMLVVVAEDDEWVLVKIKGRLDKVIEDAMRMAFEETDRGDLYERTREERGLPPTLASRATDDGPMRSSSGG